MREGIVAGGWSFAAVILAATSAMACPFCGVVGQSLAQRRDEAAVVAVGEAAGAVAEDPAGVAEQPFHVHHVLRGDAGLAGRDVRARVTAPVSGTALLFAGVAPDATDSGRWSAMAADETLLGHVAAAPPWRDPPAARLRWFAARLEHPEQAIAEDAFTEFGLAPFAAVREASDCFDAERLAAWVREPGIDPRRRGFYGLALGILAATTADAPTRSGALAALRAAITAPAGEFRAGFDGLLAGLLVADGGQGLVWIEQSGLFSPAARPTDQKHLLAALRFAGEELGPQIPREQVAAATARLLASPVVAADAAIDLTRYGAWDHAVAVAALWDSLGVDDPLVRRAVAGYLSACPRPEAREALDRIRERNPTGLAAAIEAAALPR
jgi:hypothetical protein